MQEQGCLGCHSIDGSDGIGPSLFELAEEPRQVEVDGQTEEVVVDDEYLERAIRDANAEVVSGYQAMMPSYDEATINDADLQAVVDYLMGRDDPTATQPQVDGAKLLEVNGCLGCHSKDGSDSIGPTFKGIGSREVTLMRNGEEITQQVDADYLRRALLEPGSEIVKGYPDIMPSSDNLNEEEIDTMIRYLLDQ